MAKALRATEVGAIALDLQQVLFKIDAMGEIVHVSNLTGATGYAGGISAQALETVQDALAESIYRLVNGALIAMDEQSLTSTYDPVTVTEKMNRG